MNRMRTIAAAACLMLAMAVTTAGLTVPQRIQSLHPQLAQELSIVELDDVVVELSQLEDLTVQAGSELRIYLVGEDGALFYDQNDAPIPTADVTLPRLRAARISIDQQYAVGRSAIDSVEFAYSSRTEHVATASPYIQIRFARDYAGVEDIGFEVSLAVRLAGEVQEQTTLTLRGALRVMEFPAVDDGQEIDLRDGGVVVAEEDIRGATILLENGVALTADLQKGERYFAAASVEMLTYQDGDDALEIQQYTMRAINLDRLGAKVTIESDISLHVYDASGAYLGTTNDQLPYSATYTVVGKRMQYFRP